jgi:hypothetical protein
MEDGDTAALEQFERSYRQGPMQRDSWSRPWKMCTNRLVGPSTGSNSRIIWTDLEFLRFDAETFFWKGKRAGPGAYLFTAVMAGTPKNFQSVCKIGTGFSDEDLKHFRTTWLKIASRGSQLKWQPVSEH